MKDLKEVVDNNELVALVVHSDTCPVCEHFVPVLKEISEELDGFTWEFFDMDTVEQPILETNSFPSVMVFKNGHRLFVGVGAVPKEQVKEVLEDILSGKFKTQKELEDEQMARLDAKEAEEVDG